MFKPQVCKGTQKIMSEKKKNATLENGDKNVPVHEKLYNLKPSDKAQKSA